MNRPTTLSRRPAKSLAQRILFRWDAARPPRSTPAFRQQLDTVLIPMIDYWASFGLTGDALETSVEKSIRATHSYSGGVLSEVQGVA